MTAFRDTLAIPFGWILSLFYLLTGNYLLSLFMLTLIFKLVLLPSSIKQQKGTAKQVRFSAKTKKIQELYKGDNARIQQETQALYSREGFNPMSSGCGPLVLQLPVMMGLYGVIYTPLKNVLRLTTEIISALSAGLAELGITVAENLQQIEVLKNFDAIKNIVPLAESTIEEIEHFRQVFTLWGMDLSVIPKDDLAGLWIVPALSLITSMASAVFMFVKQRQNNPEMAKNPTMGCMMLFSPLMSVYFTYILPSGVGVYWIMSNILSFIQTVVLSITHDPKKVIAQVMIDETVERRSRELSIKKMREYMNKEEVS